MTEQEWLACTDPKPMLRFLIGTNYPRVQAVEAFPNCIGSDRKLRLFGCACYYRIRYLLPDVRAKNAVEVVEGVVDGIVPVVEFERAEARIRELRNALEDRWRVSRGTERMALAPTYEALALAGVILWTEAQKAAYYASSNASLTLATILNPGAACSDSEFSRTQLAEERVQTDLLRDIFGPLPFRQIAISPALLAWNNGTIPKLAQGIYDDRAFDRLPILADALEEAGCDNLDILNHCRGAGPHVRGCWVVDLLLGKE